MERIDAHLAWMTGGNAGSVRPRGGAVPCGMPTGRPSVLLEP